MLHLYKVTTYVTYSLAINQTLASTFFTLFCYLFILRLKLLYTYPQASRDVPFTFYVSELLKLYGHFLTPDSR